MSDAALLLDTNILIHGVRRDNLWQRIVSDYDLMLKVPAPIYSIVSEAELLSFASQSHWAEPKQEQARFLLGYFTRLTIDRPEVLRAYVLIDTYSRTKGIKMGKNDLWIAATAHDIGATLITTDQDFDHLNGTLLSVQRISLKV